MDSNQRTHTLDGREVTYPVKLARRGYSAIPALDPYKGSEWDVLVSHDKMDHITKRGIGPMRELAHVVRPLLLQPKAVFRGIRDTDREISDDDWLAYILRPSFCYDYRTGEKRRPWDGEVLIAYFTDERVFYNWYWCECDVAISYLPHDYETRFITRVI